MNKGLPIFLLCLPLCIYAKNIDVDFKFYTIKGNSYHELIEAIKENRPNGFHASTRWRVNWRYQYHKKEEWCELENIKVTLSNTIHFPLWLAPKHVKAKLYHEWTRYTGALLLHELGHARIAELAYKKIKESLQFETEQSTCAELGKIANENAHDIVAKFKKIQKRYDQKTDHGKTQGARFYLRRTI